MSSDALGSLIRDHPLDGSKIVRLWDFCKSKRPGPIQIRETAIALDYDRRFVQRTFDEFCRLRLLIREDFVRCLGCDEEYRVNETTEIVECKICRLVLDENNATAFSVYRMPATLAVDHAPPPFQKKPTDEPSQQSGQIVNIYGNVGSVAGRDHVGQTNVTITYYNTELSNAFDRLLTELIDSNKPKELEATITDIKEIKRLLAEHGLASAERPRITGLWDKTKKILTGLGLAANSIQSITALFAKAAGLFL